MAEEAVQQAADPDQPLKPVETDLQAGRKRSAGVQISAPAAACKTGCANLLGALATVTSASGLPDVQVTAVVCK